jgi:serine/threonine protein kinase
VATYSVYRDAKMPPRDIKPDNILVDEGRVFIDDFGFEKFLLFEVNTQKKLT